MQVSCRPEDVGLSTARLKRIRTWMQRYVDQGRLPGALALVARHGEIACLETVGYREVSTDKSMTTDTLFRIYSMTKPITSVALMMLYEAGEFQLDDPVAEYIPAFREIGVARDAASFDTEPLHQPVTIHQLLTHTSGLTYGVFSDTVVGARYRERRTDFHPNDGALADIVARLCTIPLEFQPGTRWNYGVSTDVLGYLVEVITGQPLDAFFTEQIFVPLAMDDTSFTLSEDRVDRFAALYTCSDSDPMALVESADQSIYTGGVTTFSGGAGLLSTVSDYWRFTEILRRKGELDGVRLLGRKTVEYMTRNHLPADLAAMGQPIFAETSYHGIGFGLGFSVMLDPVKARIIGSPGEYAWGGAASTAFWIDPVEDITTIFLTQLTPSSAYPLRRELRVLTYHALID